MVEEIWNSIAEDTETLPLNAEQWAELDRRWAENEAEPSTAVPWDDARDEPYGRDG